MKELYEKAQNYLSEIKEDAPDFFNEVNQFLDDIQNDKIPETFPEHPDCFFDFSETNLKKDTIMMLVRSYCQSIGYYGVVTKDYCKELKDYIGDKKVLEIMSGRGFLAKGLSEEGVYVKATDDLSWSNMKNSVFNIENQSAIDAVKQNKDNFDILLISWPPFNEYAINDVIKEWGSKKRNPLYWWHEGCCANEEFFNMLKMKKSSIKQPKFTGLHDNLYHGQLKKNMI